MQYIHLSKQSETNYGPLQTKPKGFVEALCYLYPFNKGGYWLTVTEMKDVMFSLAEKYDTTKM